MSVTATVYVHPSGTSIGLTFEDETGTLGVVTAVNDNPTITINGGAPISLTEPVIFGGGYWAAFRRLTTTINPGDVVTYSDGFSGTLRYGPLYDDGDQGRDWIAYTGAGWLNNIGYTTNGHLGGNGTATATWDIPIPAAGTYQIAITYPTDGSYATDSPFSVYDGASLINTFDINQRVAPSDFTAEGANWKIIYTGAFTASYIRVKLTNDTTTGHIIADGVRIARTGVPGYVAYGNDVGSGAYTTDLGTVAPLSGASVINGSGSSNLPLTPTNGRQMQIGYNLTNQIVYNSPIFVSSNLFHAATLGSLYNDGTSVNSLGYPNAGVALGTALVVAPTNTNDPRNFASTQAGTYWLGWEGTKTLSLGSRTAAGSTGEAATIVQTGSGTAGATTWKTYTVSKNGSETPQTWGLDLVVTSDNPGGSTLGNVRLYMPGVATDGSEKINPEVIRMLRNARSFRAASTMLGPGSNVVDYTDWPQEGQASFGDPPNGERYVYITRIDYQGVEYLPPTYQSVEVTTAVAHGFKTGQTVRFGRVSQNSIPVTFTDTDVQDYWNAALPIIVTDATHFVVAISGVTGPSDTVATPFTAGDAYVGILEKRGLPVSYYVDICNQVGCDLYWNMPHAATDACVASTMDEIAATLDPGLKVRFAFSNECWNSVQDFPQRTYCTYKAWQAGLIGGGAYSGEPWMCKRFGEMCTIARARFVAAGRPATDVIRVLEGWWANTGWTATLATYCAAQVPQIEFDEFALAPYLTNWLSVDGFDYSDFTVHQISDMWELTLLQAGQYYEGIADAHRAALDASGWTSVPLVGYEGCLQYGGLERVDGIIARKQSMAAMYHPNQAYHVWAYLDILENRCGFTKFDWFGLSHDGWVDESDNQRAGNYPTFMGDAMEAGNGVANLAWLDNSAPPVLPRLDIAESVVGYAIEQWNMTDAVASFLNVKRWSGVIVGIGC